MSQKNYAVILAGGTGTRMGIDLPKQFLTIEKLPIIVRTINIFQNHSSIDGIIVVIHPDYIERIKQYKKDYKLDKIMSIVAGGETRQLSSYNALKALNYEDDDILIFHDAVRPFLSEEIINNCIDETIITGATDVCVKTTDTIVLSDDQGFIKEMPDRTNLRNGQTPQGFRYGIIREAHEESRRLNFTQTTDDVRLVLNKGNQVKIVEGSYENIKITNAEDIILSEAIAKNLRKVKVYKKKKIQLIEPGLFKEINESVELIGDGIVAVKPTMASICQADLRYYLGKRKPEALKKKLPMSLLHEGIGIVVDSNSNPNLSNGDRIIIIPNVPGCVYDPETYNSFARECSFCGTNFIYENHCKYVRFLSSGYDGLAQNLLFHYAKCVLKIPDSVSDESATMSELITVAYNAVKRIDMKRNSHIMIFGDGPIGYATAIVIRKIFNFPKEQVHVVGIDNLSNFDYTMISSFNDLNQNNITAPDYIFECVGGAASPSVINKAIEIINPAGKVVLMGVSEEYVPINTRDVLEKGLTFIGSSRSSRFDYIEVLPHLSNPEVERLIQNLIIPQIFNIKDSGDLKRAFDYTAEKNEWGKVLLKLDF